MQPSQPLEYVQSTDTELWLSVNLQSSVVQQQSSFDSLDVKMEEARNEANIAAQAITPGVGTPQNVTLDYTKINL